jgi:EF hand
MSPVLRLYLWEPVSNPQKSGRRHNMTTRSLLQATALVLAAAAFIASGVAFANEPYFPKAQRGFDRIDANKDGKIALAEFAPVVERRMSRLDSDNDKVVTAAELDARFAAAIEKRRNRILGLMDANRDGRITESELDNLLQAMFNSADMDRDGGLTLVELQGFKRADWRKTYLLQRTQPVQ